MAPATLSRLVVSVRRCVEGELAYQEVAAAERVPPGQHVLAASPLLDTLLRILPLPARLSRHVTLAQWCVPSLPPLLAQRLRRLCAP